MRKFALILVWAVLPFGMAAARLTLRDGTVVNGHFLSGTSQEIIFQDDAGVRRRFGLNQIQMLDFTPMSETANRYRTDDRYDNDWAMIPAGATISVRTGATISSQNAAEGQVYPATIVQDVLDRTGIGVIPRGAGADLVVRRIRDNGEFILDLDAVRVNGRRYVVNTTDVRAGDSTGLGTNKRTAEMVGGGAVLGTLLGAIAGGGKGAAIGAAAGAATGGGVQVLTRGHEIRVPVETVLNFRLEEPLHLREAR